MDSTTPNNFYQTAVPPIPPSTSPVPPAPFGGSFPTSPPLVTFSPALPEKKGPAKNIILVGVLVLTLGGLVFGFDRARSFLSRAESACVPADLREASLTPNSVEIVFQTEKACTTEIVYGTSSESLLLKIPEEIASLNHKIRLSPLLPSMTYYYQVAVDGKNVGSVRSFLTKMAQASVEAPTIPQPVPTTALNYTLEDFGKQYGTSNTTFDLDKNGVVNSADWLLYQGQRSQ